MKLIDFSGQGTTGICKEFRLAQSKSAEQKAGAHIEVVSPLPAL